MLLGERPIGFFLDQAKEPCFCFCPMGTWSGPNIWLGVARGWVALPLLQFPPGIGP